MTRLGHRRGAPRVAPEAALAHPGPSVRRGLAALACLAGLQLAGCGTPLRTLAPQDEPGPAVPLAAPAPPVRVALVLSGGSLRGLAHVGVLKVLEAEGLHPDLIVGSSIGALVGGLRASGRSAAQLGELAPWDDLDPWSNLFTTPSQRAALLESFMRRGLAQVRLEHFPTRFLAVAVERAGGCVMAFGHGDAARALSASAAMPGVFPAVVVGLHDYADGGLASPLPVRVARAAGALRVVAVDVTYHAEDPLPQGAVSSVFHAGMLMAKHLSAPDRASADLLIDPVLPPVPEVTLANRAALVAAGERAARAALPALRQLFAAAPTPAAHRGAGLAPALCEAPGNPGQGLATRQSGPGR